MLVLANCFPKSGTHLLMQMLSGHYEYIGNLNFYDDDNNPKGDNEILEQLAYGARESKGRDTFCTAHLPHKYLYKAFLLDRDVKILSLVRDLRGVAVSHANYVYNTPDHDLHKHYRGIPEEEFRIRNSITGIAGRFPDIGQRFLAYLPWHLDDDVFSLTYERIMANKEQTALHLGMYLGVPNYHVFLKNISTEKSITFRKGDPYSWKEEMSKENQALFEDIAGWTKELI